MICMSQDANRASMTLTARTTASPISRKGTSWGWLAGV
jgi:hypothetical protein